MEKMVRLLDIQPVSLNQDENKEREVLRPSEIELAIDVVHKENNVNIVDFVMTLSIYTISNRRILALRTKSVFSIVEDRSYFYGNETSSFIQLLGTLASIASAHNSAILATTPMEFSIPLSSLLSLPHPVEFQKIIFDELQSKKN